jgi:probable rRNA maturation factor
MLTDDAAMRQMNAQWRGIDKPTNVLSFPAGESPAGTEPTHLGDIAISYETVAAESTAENKAFADHLAHLAVHGYLHLVGFDHETDAEAVRMEHLETQILSGLGIADPYADPTSAD